MHSVMGQLIGLSWWCDGRVEWVRISDSWSRVCRFDSRPFAVGQRLRGQIVDTPSW